MNIKIEDEIAERLSEVMVAAGFEGNSVEEFVNAELLKVVETVRTDVFNEAQQIFFGTVTLTAIDTNLWINAIKVVRQYTGLGLKEAKDIVDGVRSGRTYSVESSRLVNRQWNSTTSVWENSPAPDAANLFVQDLRKCGCAVTGGTPDPRDIVAFRKKYGMIGAQILKDLVNDR